MVLGMRRVRRDKALVELRAQCWLIRLAYRVGRASHHLRKLTRKEVAAQTSAANAGQLPPRKPGKAGRVAGYCELAKPQPPARSGDDLLSGPHIFPES